MLTSAIQFKYISLVTGNLSKFKLQTLKEPEILYAVQNETVIACPTISTRMNDKVEGVRVDMAEMKVENKPIELITSVGSCVAICMYDSKNRCGGLAHIMLPNSAIAPHEHLPSKFADTAVPALRNDIEKLSKNGSRLSAKIAGGANMFSNLKKNNLDVGAKNISAVKAALESNRIRLLGEDVGGNHGRRIVFNLETGVATIRLFNGEIIEI